MRLDAYRMQKMQESLCADAASFDLSSGLLTACISEAKSCIDLSVARREESNDKSGNPDNFAILKGMYSIVILRVCHSFVSLQQCLVVYCMYNVFSHYYMQHRLEALQQFFWQLWFLSFSYFIMSSFFECGYSFFQQFY